MNTPCICFPRNIKNYYDYTQIINPSVISIDYKYNLGEIVVFYAPQSAVPLSTDLLISNLKIWNLISQSDNNDQSTVYINMYENLCNDSSQIKRKNEGIGYANYNQLQ